MTFHSLIAAAAALALAAPAFADWNDVSVDQFGWDNGAGVVQDGGYNQTDIHQNGWGNNAVSMQGGYGNYRRHRPARRRQRRPVSRRAARTMSAASPSSAPTTRPT